MTQGRFRPRSTHRGVAASAHLAVSRWEHRLPRIKSDGRGAAPRRRMSSTSERPEPVSSTERPHARRPTVLCVADDALLLAIYARCLSDRYDTVTAIGPEGLKVLAAGNAPEVVLADL